MITYNHAAYIREALDSVLMQQVDFAYEICLGEDGSMDGTREICLDYVSQYPDKIRLFLRDRTNPEREKYVVPYRHNTVATFEACRGKYIAMLEGDDYWTDAHKLSLQSDLLESDPGLAVIGHYATCCPEGRPWDARVIPPGPVGRFTVADILRRDIANIHTATLMLRRSKPVDWSLFSESSFADYPLLVWSLRGGCGQVLPRVMSTYRTHSGGNFSALSMVTRYRQNVVLWRILRDIVPVEQAEAADIGMLKIMVSLIAELRKEGHPFEAFRSFSEVIRRVGQMRGCALHQQAQMYVSALESLLVPRFRGARRWLFGCLRQRHAPLMKCNGAAGLLRSDAGKCGPTNREGIGSYREVYSADLGGPSGHE
ncbi:MAG TPA: glycosyltransferase family 2 protein [Phycisphaerae bacterium]|nr:glycosyltransferase family 2 protein [Phycisphaerae bacterium]HRY70126.1 glycosyltransferase family 2 protein [Phycisphaerae bacterium]HSA28266.1 glycosyltransferase family 2 protein [Phycisphaerae bacterium]